MSEIHMASTNMVKAAQETVRWKKKDKIKLTQIYWSQMGLT